VVDERHPKFLLQLFRGSRCRCRTRLFPSCFCPFVGLDHHLKLGGQRRIADLPQFHLDSEEIQIVGRVVVEEL
jgi:hypothetical protein